MGGKRKECQKQRKQLRWMVEIRYGKNGEERPGHEEGKIDCQDERWEEEEDTHLAD